MKKLLITGNNSYIGNSLNEWLKQYSNEYIIETISLRNDFWKNADFSNYDTVLHLAGIAHVSSDPKQKELYYKVNRDLAIETAEKAKQDGVEQFIFMSSIIVYSGSVLNNGVIDKSTVPRPKDFYGDSKLQAEKGIISLESENFKVAIVRPPMIYGKYSKGNYRKLSKVARKLPFFPDFYNKRSMLFIENLCEFIKILINNKRSGVFFPQNIEYIQTSEMIRIIRKTWGKKTYLTKTFNPGIKFFMKRSIFLEKIFGDFVYDKSLSAFEEKYHVENTKNSIIKSEK